MGFSIGGGIGPFRGSVRLSGRGGGSSGPSLQEIFFMTAGIALFFGGTVAAMGLRGEGGITGRVLGIIFVLMSFGGLFYSPLVGTYFATSWVYYGLTKVHYFNLLNLVMFDEPKFDSLDSFVLAIAQLIVMVVGIAVVLVTPPALVYLLLRKFHGKSSARLDAEQPAVQELPAKKADIKNPEIQVIQEINDPALGKLPAKVDASIVSRKIADLLIDDEVLNFTCAVAGEMKSKLVVFTSQRIIFLYTRNLAIIREFSIRDIENVSFSSGSFTFTTKGNKKIILLVDKSDRESIKKYLELSSVGTLTEKEFRKTKSRERK